MMAAFITVAAEATPEIATTEATAAAAAAAQQEAERVAAEKAAEEATQQTAQQGITQNASATPPGTPPASPPAANNMSAGINQANTSIGPNTMSDAPIQNAPEILPQRASTMSMEEAQTLSNELANPLPDAPPNPYLQNRITLDPNTFDSSTLANTAKPYEPSMLEKGFNSAMEWVGKNKMSTAMGLMAAGQMMNGQKGYSPKHYKSKVDMSGFQPMIPTQQPFQRSYNYQGYAVGGPVEQMSAQNAVGANQMYPQAGIQTAMYSNPDTQRPMAANVLSPESDVSVDPYTGEQRMASGGLSEEDDNEPNLTKGQKAAKGLSNIYAGMQDQRAATLAKTKSLGDSFNEGIIPRSKTQLLSSPYAAATKEFSALAGKHKLNVAQQPKTNIGDVDNYMETTEAANGGIMHGLGSYSDGGHLLRGPGDGVSDSIPAQIGDHQPARLADGEFVIPARIVSELGNGSTEAGARRLYAMMERVQNARKKSIGKGKVAVNSKADKHLPA